MMTNPLAARSHRRMSRPSESLVAAAATLSKSTPRASMVKAASAAKLPPLAKAGDGAGARGNEDSEDAAVRLRWHDAVIERYCSWRPQRLLWWESVVMVRKAGIVLLAVLVTNPFYQCAGAALLLGGALIAHLQHQPYTERLFNLLETVSLAAAASSAVISATLLQYDVTAADYLSQPPAAMTAPQWAVTVILGVMNLGTLALLVGVWVYLYGRTVRKNVKVLRHAPASPQLPFRMTASRTSSILMDAQHQQPSLHCSRPGNSGVSVSRGFGALRYGGHSRVARLHEVTDTNSPV